MPVGVIIMILYWALHTLTHGFTSKLNAQLKANEYDRKGINIEAKERAERRYYPLKAAQVTLKIAGWVKTILLTLLLAWFIFFIGAIMTGSTVFLGYPV